MMRRRDFLKILSAGVLTFGMTPEVMGAMAVSSRHGRSPMEEESVRDYLYKMQHYNEPHPEDSYLEVDKLCLLESTVKRLRRLQRTIGHGNFLLLSFDEALHSARSYGRVGPFTRKETDFLEMIFYADGNAYGFNGEKPQKNLTASIPRSEVKKIPGSGNYLFQGRPLEMYNQIRKELGDDVILTSGIRSVIKQCLLFLNKAYRYGGNLSLASRSLAPPGYSYHSVGDFDVGQVGLGSDNFTERFARTKVYRRLKEDGFLKLRYCRSNLLGVRFEPWHIKVCS